MNHNKSSKENLILCKEKAKEVEYKYEKRDKKNKMSFGEAIGIDRATLEKVMADKSSIDNVWERM